MHRIIFQAGPVTIYSYGLFVAIGFLLSTILILKDSRKFGIAPEKMFDCMIAILAGGLVGGRLLFVIINYRYYLEYPLRAFMFYEGGLAYQGAFVMAVIAGILWARAKKIPFLKAADLVAPYIALAQSLGRIGCFLNGCCYGRVAESGLLVTFPYEPVTRIPTQIYSSFILLLIFVLLIEMRGKRPFDGYIFCAYMILYSVFRFFMDFTRGDIYMFVFGMKLSQIISLVMFAGASVLYFILKVRSRKAEKMWRSDSLQ